MKSTIRSDTIVAYSQCPRKAFLILNAKEKGVPHEYIQIIKKKRHATERKYINTLKKKCPDVQAYSTDNLKKGNDILIRAMLQSNGLEADCSILEKVRGSSSLGRYSYEPTIFVGINIEGIPDLQSYYLIGLLVCEGNTSKHYSCWADTIQDERKIWRQFLEKVAQFPGTPIYHYGSYEPKAIEKLTQRYKTDSTHLKNRLVNINSYIYGKVYFPVRSNQLKEIGNFIGAKWTSPDASGLQSLVWRHHWEESRKEEYKQKLVTYNLEDCEALRLLTDELFKIGHSAHSISEVDFADQSKDLATEIGRQIHSQFKTILKSAHFGYDQNKITFRKNHNTECDLPQKRKHGVKKGYEGQRKKRPKPTRIVQVQADKVCPICKSKQFRQTDRVARRLIIDVVSTRNGLRKNITEFVGVYGWCTACGKNYAPSDIRKQNHSTLYGHGLKALLIYLRVALRLPYESIIDLLEELLGETVHSGSFSEFIKGFARYYNDTEQMITNHLLQSPFIHADEITINIMGDNQYVWVFTDGTYVVFKRRETREADLVHKFLVDYKGTLVSDFYPGYDAVECNQQKCWVHLIRDLNKDLLAAPFDIEFETFVSEVRNLIIPIMEAVQKYGLKKRNLNKFQQDIEKFYARVIIDKFYKSDLVKKYQKRFVRYQNSLFTFLEQDGIPWHNNAVERAIRHIAKQRAISSSFSASVMDGYLVLLGIRQTCRFLGKSFFKFLFSGEKDLDKFKSIKKR